MPCQPQTFAKGTSIGGRLPSSSMAGNGMPGEVASCACWKSSVVQEDIESARRSRARVPLASTLHHPRPDGRCFGVRGHVSCQHDYHFNRQVGFLGLSGAVLLWSRLKLSAFIVFLAPCCCVGGRPSSSDVGRTLPLLSILCMWRLCLLA